MLTRGNLPAGNVKMAVFDCLLGVNVKELDKLAHGTASAADDDTELVIMMIGLGGIIATILVVGAWCVSPCPPGPAVRPAFLR